MTGHDALKPGWRRVKFGDVVRLSKVRSQNPLEDGYDRYVGLEHLEPGDLRVRSWGNVADGTTFTNVFKPGQVLFGKRRAYQRKVAVADFAGVCSGDIYVLESKNPNELLPELLPFICQTDAFFGHAVGTSAGSLSPRTNWASLSDYDLLLPDIAGQEVVLQVLNSSDHAVSEYRVALIAAKNLFVSALLNKFESINGSIFPIGMRYNLQLGKMSSEKSRNGGNQKHYIKNNNVLWGKFDFSDLPEMSFDKLEQEKFALLYGDLLVCEGGEIGRCAIWRDEIPGIFYQKALHRLRPKSDDDIPEFLYFYLRYCALRGILDGISTGTTIKHLPMEKLASLRLSFPERSEQKAISEVLLNLESNILNLERRIESIRQLSGKISGIFDEGGKSV